jgi:hypothetical protein
MMVYARCKQATADQQGDAEAIALDLLAGLIFSERSVGTQILEEVLASSICFFLEKPYFFRFFRTQVLGVTQGNSCRVALYEAESSS